MKIGKILSHSKFSFILISLILPWTLVVQFRLNSLIFKDFSWAFVQSSSSPKSSRKEEVGDTVGKKNHQNCFETKEYSYRAWYRAPQLPWPNFSQTALGHLFWAGPVPEHVFKSPVLARILLSPFRENLHSQYLTKFLIFHLWYLFFSKNHVKSV